MSIYPSIHPPIYSSLPSISFPNEIKIMGKQKKFPSGYRVEIGFLLWTLPFNKIKEKRKPEAQKLQKR